MNRRQKEMIQISLNEEEDVLKRLEKAYKEASENVADKIVQLSMRTDLENVQSIIYQQKYQSIILQQIDGVLSELGTKQYNNIIEYLEKSYENGFVGSLYDLAGQDIPFVFPIDQNQVVDALMLDSKLSEGLYNTLGENIDDLKKRIRSDLSRGIIEGKNWNQISKDIAGGMINSPFRTALNNAMRITRTEGHRVQMTAQMDACEKAKEKGADIVKQWDATLDGRTRESHQAVDGEIRELDEPFSNGLMYPSDPNGSAGEVINCRCALLQRAKWMLDEDELKTLQDRANFYGLDKTENFDDFKQKYLGINSDIQDIVPDNIRYKNTTSDELESLGIAYNQVIPRTTNLTNEEIINVLGGGDRTVGSCASVGLAYIGQRNGLNVLDFRDGESREWFSSKINKILMWKELGVNSVTFYQYKGCVANGKQALKSMVEGAEYYLSVGRHASIVRLNNGVCQYLELQSAWDNGWHDFSKNLGDTLKNRFGCGSLNGNAVLVDIDELKDNNEFMDILGYINTSEANQRKGSSGYAK